jgi:hypothetical protein
MIRLLFHAMAAVTKVVAAIVDILCLPLRWLSRVRKF